MKTDKYIPRATEAKLEVAMLAWVERVAKKHGVPHSTAAAMVLDHVNAALKTETT